MSLTPELTPTSEPSGGVTQIQVPSHASGQRLDNFLITALKGVPKTHIYRIIRKGEVRLNKKRAKPDSRIQAGDMVRLPPIRVSASEAPITPSESLINLLKNSILFENSSLLIINKPQGLAVHLGSGLQIGLIEALRWMKSQEGSEAPFLELAHRIDKDTSGCIAIAKNPLILKELQNKFKEKKIQKTYLLLVHGKWPDSLQEINVPLLKRDVQDSEKIVTVSPEGKISHTKFAIVETFARCTLMKAMPSTGRTHQIRVHAQYAGHPLIGDTKYTNERSSAWQEKGVHLCLHAYELAFELADGTKINVRAPLQSNMQRLLIEQRSTTLSQWVKS